MLTFEEVHSECEAVIKYQAKRFCVRLGNVSYYNDFVQSAWMAVYQGL